MKYLKNNICNFNPLFKINYSKKKNIISTCFFKMENKGYKDLTVYINGLIKLNKYINTLPDYYLRLFIDNSIYNDKNIMNQLNNLNKLEIVVYSCPNHMIDNNFHYGTFGTLVRFFPMFDFPNNDANIVIISDIDSMSLKYNFKYLKVLNNDLDKIYLIKYGNIGKASKYNNNIMYNNIINSYTIAQNFTSIKRIPNKVILDFLQNIKSTDIKLSFYVNENLEDNIENKKKFNLSNNYIYGIDEYFLNNTFINYFIDNKIPYANILKFEINAPFYYLIFRDDIKSITNENKITLNNLLNKILNKLNIKYDNESKIYDKYKLIDDMLYDNTISDNQKINIIKLLYSLVIFIKNKNKNKYYFLFKDDLIDLILNKKYFGVYFFTEIIYQFLDKNSKFLKYDKFNDSDLKDLEKLNNIF